MKLKRTLTIEIDCIKITSIQSLGHFFWCENCQQRTKFLSPAEILEIIEQAEIAGILKTIDKSVLHFYQSSAEEKLICLKSILDSSNRLDF